MGQAGQGGRAQRNEDFAEPDDDGCAKTEGRSAVLCAVRGAKADVTELCGDEQQRAGRKNGGEVCQGSWFKAKNFLKEEQPEIRSLL